MSGEQGMDFDFGSAIEKLQDMMSSDDGKATLDSIIGSFMGSSGDDKRDADYNTRQKPGNADKSADIDQAEMMMKIARIMSAMKSRGDDESAALLYALKPYLNKHRQEKTDSAVKIMGMVTMFKQLKDSGIDFDL